MSDVIPEQNSEQNSETSEIDQMIADATGGIGTENSQNEDVVVSGTENDSPKIDPNWEKALSAIPEEFHPHLTGVFREWDQGVQNRFETVQQTYAPYKDLAEHQVPFQHVDEALQIRQAILNNPRQVFDYLAQQQGIDLSALGRQGQNTDPEELNVDDLDSQTFDIEKHPKYLELKQQVEGVAGFISQQEQQRINQQNEQYITSSFQTLEQKYGEIPDDDKVLIAQMAVAAGNDDIVSAGSAFFDRIGKSAPAPAGQAAPPVITGNRGLPMKVADFASMSPEERSEKLAQLMAGMGDNS